MHKNRAVFIPFDDRIISLKKGWYNKDKFIGHLDKEKLKINEEYTVYENYVPIWARIINIIPALIIIVIYILAVFLFAIFKKSHVVENTFEKYNNCLLISKKSSEN